MNRREILYVLAALIIGGASWFVVNLDPIWQLAWFVPGLLVDLARPRGHRRAGGRCQQLPLLPLGHADVAGLAGAAAADADVDGHLWRCTAHRQNLAVGLDGAGASRGGGGHGHLA